MAFAIPAILAILTFLAVFLFSLRPAFVVYTYWFPSAFAPALRRRPRNPGSQENHTYENSGLHEAGPAKGRPAETERKRHVDSRRRLLRSQRARRLCARRSAAAEGKARRRSRGDYRRAGALAAGFARRPGQGRRSRDSSRRRRFCRARRSEYLKGLCGRDQR